MLIPVYIVVREDNQQFTQAFGSREEAEAFTKSFRVPTEIIVRLIRQ
jgi:hypothetical protein